MATNGHAPGSSRQTVATRVRLEAMLARSAGGKTRPAHRSTAGQTDLTRHKLRCGTRVLVLREPSVPVVAVRATWVGGLRYEDDRSAGISTLIASLLTRGTKKRDAETLMREVEGMAGSLSGYAGRNSLGLQAEFLTRHLEPGLDLVTDCLQNATFPDSEIAHERRLILEDIRAQEDNLTHVVFRAFHVALWTKHPYRLDPLGTSASLGGLTRRRLLAFFHQHYQPSNLTLAIVGDVEPDAVIHRLSTSLEAAAKGSARPSPPAAEPPVVAPRVTTRFLPREQAHLVLGFPGATVSSPDRFSLELLAQVLSGQGGRLFVEIREKRALAYRVSAFSLEGIDPGYFAVYVSTSPEQVDEVLRSIRLELRKVAEEGVGAGRARTRAALPHRNPRHRTAAQKRHRGHPGLSRGLRAGLAGVPEIRRSHRCGRSCRDPSGGSELSSSRAGGASGLEASGLRPTRGQTPAETHLRPIQISTTPMSPRIDQNRNLLTNLVLIFPLLIIYQLGVLLTYPMLNGADFVSGILFGQLGFTQPQYLMFVLVVTVVFLIAVATLNRRQPFQTRIVVPIVLESSIYALTMGSLIVLIMTNVFGISPRLSTGIEQQGILGRIVMSLGAGVYEELVFRLGLLGGIAALGERVFRWGRWPSVAVAFVVSALLFSAAHHVPPYGDPVRIDVFTFRVLAGVFFGALFWLRGLAVAVYTHAFYDVYVLLIR